MKLSVHVNQLFAQTDFYELFISIIVAVCLLFWKTPVLNISLNQKNILICSVVFFLYLFLYYFKFDNNMTFLLKIGAI